MTQVFLTTGIILGLLLFLPLYRIARGPTIFDRLVGAGTMGTKTMVLLLVMGYAVGREDMFVDISLGYGLALLVGTLVTAKYLEHAGGELGAAADAGNDAPGATPAAPAAPADEETPA